jgi:hypothetical protein
MCYKVTDLQKPLGVILAAFVVFCPPLVRSVTIDFPQDGTRLELITETAAEPNLQVSPVKGSPLMGRTEHKPDRLVFVPALPFISGQPYLAEWTEASGQRQKAEFKILPAKARIPKVRLEPSGVPLPANALKFYLHFSEPMEQGVFLDRLRLEDQTGKEVIGPFRETELWSPDGKRLTVWFHPGRQKVGVNLNTDEGPVLHPDARYTLVISHLWRSTSGTAFAQDEKFPFTTVAADHQSPRINEWKITTPKAGTREPLTVQFDELLDSAMLKTALRISNLAGEAQPDETGKSWTFTPAQPWAKGTFELHSDPNLEDLAGNSLTKPFEVDLSAPAPSRAVTVLSFFVASPE